MSARFELEDALDEAILDSAEQKLKRIELARMEALEPIGHKMARLRVGFDLEQTARMLNPAFHAAEQYTKARMEGMANTLSTALLDNQTMFLRSAAPSIQALSNYGVVANGMMAGQLRDQWKPILTRWSQPAEAVLAAQLASMSTSILEAARPLVYSAATQFLSNLQELSLQLPRVQLANLYQPPTVVLPLHALYDDELLPDIPLWSDPPPAAPPQEAAPSSPPGSESVPLPGQPTTEDLEAAIRRVLEQQKPTLTRRVVQKVGEKAIDILIVKVAFDHFQITDAVVYVFVKSVHVVVEGASYVLRYIP
jgi:hypothetical protein